MLSRDELKDIITGFVPEAEFPEGTQLPEVVIPAAKLTELMEKLKSDSKTSFNYLISHTAVDFSTHFTLVYHLESVEKRHLLVVKVKLEGRENASVDSLAAIFPTCNYFEREVFDLFGVRYNNHPNLKRLFLEDDYGYPLRKDFRDEVNMIER